MISRWPDQSFVETSVSRVIFDVLERARSERKCAAIVGAPGVGKTAAIREWAARHHIDSCLTCTGTVAGSMRSLLEEIADLLGVYRERGIAATHRALMRTQYNAGEVLILDEAQNLPDKHYREVLFLWDEAKLPIVFCGNPEVLKRVNIDSGPYSQISWRVTRREQVYGIEAEDADRLASRLGVEGMDAYRALRIIAERFHAAGVVKAVEEARHFSGYVTPVRIEHIRDALESLPYLKSAFKTLNRSQRIDLTSAR